MASFSNQNAFNCIILMVILMTASAIYFSYYADLFLLDGSLFQSLAYSKYNDSIHTNAIPNTSISLLNSSIPSIAIEILTSSTTKTKANENEIEEEKDEIPYDKTSVFDVRVMDIWGDLYKTKARSMHGKNPSLYTIVSGYVYEQNLSRADWQHSYSRYISDTANMYGMDEPMVMFECLEGLNRTTIDYYTSIRQTAVNKSTILIPITKKDLLFSEFLTHGYNETMEQITLTCLLWMNKFAFLRFVTIMNPFRSKYFLWLDAGFFKGHKFQSNVRSPITWKLNGRNQMRLLNKLQHLNDDKVLFADAELGKLGKLCSDYLAQHKINQSLSTHYQKSSIPSIMLGSNILGGCDFISSAKGIRAFSDIYLSEFELRHFEGGKVCYDQGFYGAVSCVYPDLANFVWCNGTDRPGGVYQLWRWLGDKFQCGDDDAVTIYNLSIH